MAGGKNLPLSHGTNPDVSSVTFPTRRAKGPTRFCGASSHAKEDNFLVANRAPVTVQNDGAGTNDALKATPVSLISVSIPVQFQITNVTDWAYNNADATNLLQSLATREVARFLAGADLNNVMSSNRLEAAETLRDNIQTSANEYKLGAKIIFVGLQDIHPPTTVAGDYEKVIGAEQTKFAISNAAQAYAISNSRWPGRRRSRPRISPTLRGCNWKFRGMRRRRCSPTRFRRSRPRRPFINSASISRRLPTRPRTPANTFCSSRTPRTS